MFIVEFHHARNPRDRRQILLGSDRRRKNAAPEKAKDAELDKYFGAASAGTTKRAQAEATWGKCPHSSGQTSFAANFFHWHRMYVFFFERIVRNLSGDDGFALPYWGYMDGESSQRLPPEFTSGDPRADGGADGCCAARGRGAPTITVEVSEVTP